MTRIPTVFFLFFILSVSAYAGPNTDIQVESQQDLSSYFNGNDPEPEEKFKLLGDDNTNVGFDSDGNPALNSRF